MSYRRALAGVASRGPGRLVSARSLGGIVMDPPRRPLYSRGKVPDWYRAMQGTSLGDDSLDAMNADAQWKKDLLAGQRELIAAQKQWATGDRFQKWVAIGATLAIPLSAAIWRALGVGRRRAK